MTFIIGPDHVVHAKACRNTHPDGLLYITKAKSHPELRIWLTNPDVKDNHSGLGMLVPCPECIEEE